MKKTKAYSLEEDVIRTIEEYKNKYNLSSASSALERIILVELPKKTNFEEIKGMIKDLKNHSFINYSDEITVETENIDDIENIEKKLQIKNSSLEDSFKSSIASMPE
ncbi:hypothetical protein K5V21_17340 [Clostridium sardiniense]|uniref:Uncharacterized protein n=1 Tax=Clostridium sardiniense TaxID=29369 RepID=A0ABS7L291_CLOSR|nr:hypothetical protein [Clostridium sardiniense]MBY0757198.1 hypothetical protein [Clostridium sardiniense]MDQ0461625.1 hypothetical protein [Clostridium sardiniense]